jgi:F-type H+-transporting ATPase subunit a
MMIYWFLMSSAQAAEKHGKGGGIDPLHQFHIERYVPFKIFGVDVSFTNASLWMVMAILAVTGFLLYSMRHATLVPNRVQSVGEIAYEFVAKMVRESAGHEGMKYFPVIFSIFVFVLALNLLGMIPLPGLGAFTVTSHIIVTFALAAFVFLGVTLIGIAKHGFGFFKLFVPAGVPVWLLPLITIIETISYFIRPISLSVRLFANMMAGHTMLAVFGSFVVGMGAILGWAPLLFMVFIIGLEILVAFLQAYVFAVLSSIYLNDALHAADRHDAT